ncbi:hypothetical protein CYMTET_27367 [Cymbomonas tetramitiformis]|uniref:NACHT domain-containing protein n=1 Tax=Cymbomonas tetramitiformis TaxID=36881 RepID=A0AAE0FPY2_9CHLO|nr:hypothetical protein CYMTET_27367 [Cymbomonas tetramitiformis]
MAGGLLKGCFGPTRSKGKRDKRENVGDVQEQISRKLGLDKSKSQPITNEINSSDRGKFEITSFNDGNAAGNDWNPFPCNVMRLFESEAEALAAHAESVSDEESFRRVMCALQFFTGSALAVGGAVEAAHVIAFENIVGHLLDALYLLCRHRGAFPGGTRVRQRVAETLHKCVDKLYDWYVVQKKRKAIPSSDKAQWGEKVTAWSKIAEVLVSYAQALQKDAAVGTGLLYEALCIQQGIAMLKDETKEGLAIAGTMGMELGRSVLSMKPSPEFIGAIAEGVKFGFKQIAKERDGRLFELIFYINTFFWQVRTALQDPQAGVADIIQCLLDMEAQLLGTAPQWQVAYAWQMMLTELVVSKTGAISFKEVEAAVASEGIESERACTLQAQQAWDLMVAKQWLVPPHGLEAGSLKDGVVGVVTGISSGMVGPKPLTQKLRSIVLRDCQPIPFQLRTFILKGLEQEAGAPLSPSAPAAEGDDAPSFRGLLGFVDFDGSLEEDTEDWGKTLTSGLLKASTSVASMAMAGQSPVEAVFGALEERLEEAAHTVVSQQALIVGKIAPKVGAAMVRARKVGGMSVQLTEAPDDGLATTSSKLDRRRAALPLLIRELRQLQKCLNAMKTGVQAADRMLGEASGLADGALSRLSQGAASLQKLACCDAREVTAEIARRMIGQLTGGALLDALLRGLREAALDPVKTAVRLMEAKHTTCAAALRKMEEAVSSGSRTMYSLQLEEVRKVAEDYESQAKEMRGALLEPREACRLVVSRLRGLLEHWESLVSRFSGGAAKAMRKGLAMAKGPLLKKALKLLEKGVDDVLEPCVGAFGEAPSLLRDTVRQIGEHDPVGDGTDTNKAAAAGMAVRSQLSVTLGSMGGAMEELRRVAKQGEGGLEELLQQIRGAVTAAVGELEEAGKEGLAAMEAAVVDEAGGVVAELVGGLAGPEFERARLSVMRLSGATEQLAGALNEEQKRFVHSAREWLGGLAMPDVSVTLEEMVQALEVLSRAAQDLVGGENASLTFVEAGLLQQATKVKEVQAQMVTAFQAPPPIEVGEGGGSQVRGLMQEIVAELQPVRKLLTDVMQAMPDPQALMEAAEEAKDVLAEVVEEQLGSLAEGASELLSQFGVDEDDAAMLLTTAVSGIQLTLGALVTDDAWRVREGVVNSLHVLQYTFEEDADHQQEAEGLVESVQQALVWRRAMETRTEVIKAINYPGAAQGMQRALQENWESQKEKVQAAMEESMRRVEELSQQAAETESPEERKALWAEYKEAQEELEVRLGNLGGMEQQLGTAINFLKDMQKTLFRMEQKLAEISEQVAEIGVAVRYLAGRPIDEVFTMHVAKMRVKQAAAQKEVYIPLQAQRMHFDKDGRSLDSAASDLLQHTMEFIHREQQGELLLISGYSGSGKTTFMDRVLMNRLWEEFEIASRTPGQTPYVPLYCSLPLLKQPLTDLIEESLEKQFYFDTPQIREWKDALLYDPPRYGLVLVLDSYDELKMEYFEKNLYDSNDVEEKALLHKVIVTCRAEPLNGQQDYTNWFKPMQTTNAEFDALAAFSEFRIAPFDNRLEEYVCAHSAHEFVYHVLPPGLSVAMPEIPLGQDSVLLLKGAGFENDQMCEELAALHGMLGAGTAAASAAQDSTRLYAAAADIFQQLSNRHKGEIPDSHLAMWALVAGAGKCAAAPLGPEEHEGEAVIPAEILEKARLRWTAQDYLDNVRRLPELVVLLSTPFMMEITTQILQRILRGAGEEQELKKQVLATFSTRGEQVWKALRTHKIIQKLPEIQRLLEESGSQCPILERISELEPDERRRLRFSLRRKPITRYLIYTQFLGFWFEREVHKHLKRSSGVQPADLLWDVQEYSKRLAVKMLSQNLSKVVYDQRGGLFRTENEWDRFFIDSEQLRLVRQSAPLRSTNNAHSFIHKSVQEYLVASQLLDELNNTNEGATSTDWMLKACEYLGATFSRGNALDDLKLGSEQLKRYLLEAVAKTGGKEGKVADHNRRRKRLQECLQCLEKGSLNSLDVSSEEAVIDFVADRLLMDTELAGQFRVAAGLAQTFPTQLQGARENIWQILQMPLPRREGHTLLMQAVKNDARELLTQVLDVAHCLSSERGMAEYVHQASKAGVCAVHLCARYGHVGALDCLLSSRPFSTDLEAAKQLLHWETNPNHTSTGVYEHFATKQTPLHVASLFGQTEFAERLLNEIHKSGIISPSPLLLMEDARGRTPLHLCALRGHVDAARLLMAKCQSLGSTRPALLEAIDCDEWTPLHHAAAHGSEPTAKALISAATDDEGLDPSEYAARRNVDGETALHLAAKAGNSKVMRTLLDAVSGAKLFSVPGGEAATTSEARDRTADPAASVPAEGGKGKALGGKGKALLAQYLADTTSKRETALHLAAQGGHVKSLVVLLSAAPPEPLLRAAREVDERTAVHLAAAGGHAAALGELLRFSEAEAAVAVTDAFELTPLHLAALQDSACLQMLLKAAGRSKLMDLLASPDQHGWTALHFASAVGSAESVRVILQSAKSPQAKARLLYSFARSHSSVQERALGPSFTPLQLAAVLDHPEVVSLLLAAAPDSMTYANLASPDPCFSNAAFSADSEGAVTSSPGSPASSAHATFPSSLELALVLPFNSDRPLEASSIMAILKGEGLATYQLKGEDVAMFAMNATSKRKLQEALDMGVLPLLLPFAPPRLQLLHAVLLGDLPAAQKALEKGALASSVYWHGVSALQAACLRGDAAVVGALLKAAGGAADVVLTQDREECGPIHTAIFCRYPEVCALLLRHVASAVSAQGGRHGSCGAMQELAVLRGPRGRTPLMYLCESGWHELVGVLLKGCKAPAEVDVPMVDAHTAEEIFGLLLAAQQGHVEVVQALLDAVKEMDASSDEAGVFEYLTQETAGGDSALSVAAGNGDVKLVALLLEAAGERRAEYARGRAGVEACGGRRPLIWAAQPRREVQCLLLEALESPSAANTSGTVHALETSAMTWDAAAPALLTMLAKSGVQRGQLLYIDAQVDTLTALPTLAAFYSPALPGRGPLELQYHKQETSEYGWDTFYSKAAEACKAHPMSTRAITSSCAAAGAAVTFCFWDKNVEEDREAQVTPEGHDIQVLEVRGNSPGEWDAAAGELVAQLEKAGVRRGQLLAVDAHCSSNFGKPIFSAHFAASLPDQGPLDLHFHGQHTDVYGWDDFYRIAASLVDNPRRVREGPGSVVNITGSCSIGSSAALYVFWHGGPNVEEAAPVEGDLLDVQYVEARAAGDSWTEAAEAVIAKLQELNVRRGQILSIDAHNNDPDHDAIFSAHFCRGAPPCAHLNSEPWCQKIGHISMGPSLGQLRRCGGALPACYWAKETLDLVARCGSRSTNQTAAMLVVLFAGLPDKGELRVSFHSQELSENSWEIIYRLAEKAVAGCDKDDVISITGAGTEDGTAVYFAFMYDRSPSCFVPAEDFHLLYEDRGCGASEDLSIWRPVLEPGCVLLGDHVKLGYGAPTAGVCTGSTAHDSEAFARPQSYHLEWHQPNGRQQLWVWRAEPPPGYVALGVVCTLTKHAPRVDLMRCVRQDLAAPLSVGGPEMMWNYKTEPLEEDTYLAGEGSGAFWGLPLGLAAGQGSTQMDQRQPSFPVHTVRNPGLQHIQHVEVRAPAWPSAADALQAALTEAGVRRGQIVSIDAHCNHPDHASPIFRCSWAPQTANDTM